jgi:cytochrome c-type biogenesis protein CcmH/NrfF
LIASLRCVTTAEGRAGFLGHELRCADCVNATLDGSRAGKLDTRAE